MAGPASKTPPITLNRRRFLGCSAAAGLALTQGQLAEAAGASSPVRLGVIGLGTRGTSLLRTLLELPGAHVAVVCDAEPRHRDRAAGIVEKATGTRPAQCDRAERVWDNSDVSGVVVALPCDRHFAVYRDALHAGKHLYAEKPLALTLSDCDQLIAESARFPQLRVHVGFQRRSNPRYRDGVALIRQGELGTLLEGRATWVSSNGPTNGHGNWLAHRDRSGDWMIEQAVHVWDLFHWLTGAPPVRAYGHGNRAVFARQQPGRDMTDHYSVQLEWADGFHASFLHSWVAPADDRFTGVNQQVIAEAGGFDFGSGALTFREKSRPRQTLHPGNQPDTRLALQAFLDAVRADSAESVTPPVSLVDAREATLTGLLVRKAVDDRRIVTRDEIVAGG